MSRVCAEEKQGILGEIFLLLHEQEKSLFDATTKDEQNEYALRAKRINDLLEEIL